MRRTDNKHIRGGGGGTIVLMIGLYLIILAFFILLNAISDSSDAKYEKATNSLKDSFGFVSGEIEPNSEKFNITIEEFYTGIKDKLSGIVVSYFPAGSFDIYSEVGLITITLPTSSVFDKDSSEVDPLVYSFFFDMTNMLNNLTNGVEIQLEQNIEAIKNIEDESENKKIINLSIDRASEITTIIKQEKPYFKQIKSSVNLGEKDVIRCYLVFTIQDYQQALLSYRDYIQ